MNLLLRDQKRSFLLTRLCEARRSPTVPSGLTTSTFYSRASCEARGSQPPSLSADWIVLYSRASCEARRKALSVFWSRKSIITPCEARLLLRLRPVMSLIFLPHQPGRGAAHIRRINKQIRPFYSLAPCEARHIVAPLNDEYICDFLPPHARRGIIRVFFNPVRNFYHASSQEARP